MKKALLVIGLLVVFLASGCKSLKGGECEGDVDCRDQVKGVGACYKEPPAAKIGKCMTVKEARAASERYARKKSGKCQDKDGDGVKAGDACDPPVDCNDSDPLIKPGASELCDSKDNNCNDEINEGLKGCVGTILGGKQDPVVKFMSTMTAGVEVAPNGDIYICDEHRIYKMDATTRKIIRLAGSNKPGNDDRKGTLARFDKPRGMVLDSSGNLYITECGSNCVRRMDPDLNVTVWAGKCSSEADDTGLDLDGDWATARFWCPIDIDIEKDGSLLVVDMLNSKIKRITKDRKVETLAGIGGKQDDEGYVVFGYADGPLKKAQFDEPAGIAVAPDGAVYIADQKNNCIRKIADDKVTTFAGRCETGKDKGGYQDGSSAAAKFKLPNSVDVAPDGAVWVTDTGNHCIRKISGGQVTTVTGTTKQQGYYDGPLKDALFNGPQTISAAGDGSIYVVDTGNYRVRHIIP